MVLIFLNISYDFEPWSHHDGLLTISSKMLVVMRNQYGVFTADDAWVFSLSKRLSLFIAYSTRNVLLISNLFDN